MKELRHERLHVTWFHLYETLWKSQVEKVPRIKKTKSEKADLRFFFPLEHCKSCKPTSFGDLKLGSVDGYFVNEKNDRIAQSATAIRNWKFLKNCMVFMQSYFSAFSNTLQ